MELELTTRRQVTGAMLARYAKGNRAEKGEVLDQLVGVTGWHRDHARKALRHHDELVVSDELTEALLSMSAATIDRRLAGHRQKVQIGKGRAMTRTPPANSTCSTSSGSSSAR